MCKTNRRRGRQMGKRMEGERESERGESFLQFPAKKNIFKFKISA